MLVDKDNLDSLLEFRSESVQMRVRVFSQVGPAHHGAMPRPSVVRSRVSESELSEIVGDELAKDGDAGFERDDERDVAEDAEAG